jgi:tetratricopeptide (TPR) repeat protein
MTYQVDYLYGWSPAGTDYEEKIIGQANRAISLAPDDPRGYWPKSNYLRMSNRAIEALQVADDGLATNPNASNLYQARSFAEVALGRFDQAISDAEQAIRLSPTVKLLTERWAVPPALAEGLRKAGLPEE